MELWRGGEAGLGRGLAWKEMRERATPMALLAAAVLATGALGAHLFWQAVFVPIMLGSLAFSAPEESAHRGLIYLLPVSRAKVAWSKIGFLLAQATAILLLALAGRSVVGKVDGGQIVGIFTIAWLLLLLTATLKLLIRSAIVAAATAMLVAWLLHYLLPDAPHGLRVPDEQVALAAALLMAMQAATLVYLYARTPVLELSGPRRFGLVLIFIAGIFELGFTVLHGSARELAVAFFV